MGVFEDLKNTKISDTVFYLMFILALVAPGTAYALCFHFDIFKELDSWKAFLMVISISAPLIVSAALFTSFGNIGYFAEEDGLKTLVFLSSSSALLSGYGSLCIGSVGGWDFTYTALWAIAGASVSGLIFGLSSRIG